MNRILYNIIAFFAMAVFVVVLILGHVSYAATPVVCEAESFAYQYASERNLPIGELPDTMKDALDWRYETFEYNNTSEGLLLTKYNGISADLVIPDSIDGSKVTGIDESLFDNTSIKDIYVSENVGAIPEKSETTVLHLNKNDKRVEDLKTAGWIVETYDDSETPNYNLGTVPFEYNETDTSVDLKVYTGDESVLVIPSYINGKPVTDVSFDMLGNFSLVVLPATLTSISGTLAKTLFTPLFAIELIFTLIAFLIAMVVFNVKMPKLQRTGEVVLTGPQIVITVFYLIAQVIFAVLSIHTGRVNLYTAIIVSSILLVIEIAFVFLAGTGRKHVEKVDQQIKSSTEFMDNLKLETANLTNGITNSQIKRAVEEVVDEIQYSSPVSKDSLKMYEEKIAKEVEQLREAIAAGNDSEILKLSAAIVRDIKDRNNRAKS